MSTHFGWAYTTKFFRMWERPEQIVEETSSMPRINTGFVAAVKQWANDNYDRGGDVIVECFTDEEIFAQFQTLEDAKRFCKLRKEREDDVRGEIF